MAALSHLLTCLWAWGLTAGWVKRQELPGDCCCDWQDSFPPTRLMKGLRRDEEELFAEVYQPLVAEPAKQEELL